MKPVHYAVLIVWGTVLNGSFAAGVPLVGAGAGTTVAGVYKGLVTTHSYQPLPLAVPEKDGGVAASTYSPLQVSPISAALRREYDVDPFYTKHVSVAGIVILGSDKVSDWALLEAAYLMDHQLQNSPKWVHDALTANKVRLAVMAVVEYTMDLPENRDMENGAYEDERCRGLGGMPCCSCGEENLLSLRGDPYGSNGKLDVGENIAIHEFGHTLADAIKVCQGRKGPFWTKLNQLFKAAKAPGGRLERFNRTRGNDPVYASTSAHEYWAEGVQAWFDAATPDHSGGLAIRDDVKKKDPQLAVLLAEIYGDGSWRYFTPTAKKTDGTPRRPPAERAHLTGFDALRPRFPVFDFKKSPRIMAAKAKAGFTSPRRPSE